MFWMIHYATSFSSANWKSTVAVDVDKWKRLENEKGESIRNFDRSAYAFLLFWLFDWKFRNFLHALGSAGYRAPNTSIGRAVSYRVNLLA